MPFLPTDAIAKIDIDRVQAVLNGMFSASDLDEDEQEIFFDLLGQRPDSESERAAYAIETLQEAGNVGYDEAGLGIALKD